jgi:hypothetical protein
MAVAKDDDRWYASFIKTISERSGESLMAVLVHQCPHCMADRMTLQVTQGPQNNKRGLHTALLFCPDCSNPSAAALYCDPMWFGLSVSMEAMGARVVDIWPKPPNPEVPERLPEPVAKAYLQGERNFAQANMEEAAAGMYGRSLDVALKEVVPDMPKGTLAQRIKRAVEKGHLTPALGDWAGEIRAFRNDALHEVDGITRADLTQIRAFLDIFMRNVFSLPRMLEERRAQTIPNHAINATAPIEST